MQLTQNDKVGRAPRWTGQIQAEGVVGADGAWSARGRVERAAVQQRCPPCGTDYPLAKK
jgi:hypothetical protein